MPLQRVTSKIVRHINSALIRWTVRKLEGSPKLGEIAPGKSGASSYFRALCYTGLPRGTNRRDEDVQPSSFDDNMVLLWLSEWVGTEGVIEWNIETVQDAKTVPKIQNPFRGTECDRKPDPRYLKFSRQSININGLGTDFWTSYPIMA